MFFQVTCSKSINYENSFFYIITLSPCCNYDLHNPEMKKLPNEVTVVLNLKSRSKTYTNHR